MTGTPIDNAAVVSLVDETDGVGAVCAVVDGDAVAIVATAAALIDLDESPT